MLMKMPLISRLALALTIALPGVAAAEMERYVIDTTGAHAFIQFRIKHLGYSWLYGRFNEFSGTFSYDPDASADSSVAVTVKTSSLDSNHAERDKHLRDEKFLDVAKFPEASFKSTSYKETGVNRAVLEGELTLKGITKPITIQVDKIGSGPDPWGGYRRGFQGTTEFALKDFGIDYNLGPASRKVEMILSVEGVRQ
jgi:polyisoprenoid-binding protein YceI